MWLTSLPSTNPLVFLKFDLHGRPYVTTSQTLKVTEGYWTLSSRAEALWDILPEVLDRYL